MIANGDSCDHHRPGDRRSDRPAICLSLFPDSGQARDHDTTPGRQGPTLQVHRAHTGVVVTRREAAAELVPQASDLPGSDWVALDELVSGGGGGEAELIDCVGPDFPGPDETVESASSPHFVRPNGQLVHGISVVLTTSEAGGRAAAVLRDAAFARCLGGSVMADLGAAPDDVEPLAVDAIAFEWGHRIRFTGASGAGVLPIHLDLVVVDGGDAVVLLLFANTPAPFPDEERIHVTAKVSSRLPGACT